MEDSVYVVWKGNRDYEEDVAVFSTRDGANAFLAENGVQMRDNPAPQIEEQSLMDEEWTPWGILEVPYGG